MPAINFMAQFADDVEYGRKRQTVRLRRRNPIKAGDTLYLFTGMRTPRCRRLGNPVCQMVRDITVTVTDTGTLKLDGTALSRAGADAFARADGFADMAELREFFSTRYGLPFRGDVIYW